MKGLNEFIEACDENINKQIKNIHTALPGIIIAYSPANSRVVVKPSLQFKVEDSRRINYPAIVDVPVQFPTGIGGSAGVTFPLQSGDSCLLVFSESALDDWGQGESDDMRSFDLTDAMCIPGMYFRGTAVAANNPDDVCLMYGDKGIRITAGGEIIINASKITISGEMNSSSDIIAMGVSLNSHVHAGCQGGSTGGPS